MEADQLGFPDELRRAGYNKEEEYFYRLNRELIEERRARLDAQRSPQRAAQEQAAFWMKCPKCGTRMRDVELAGIRLEQCPACHGVYFDAGELETLLGTKEQKSFMEALWDRMERGVAKVDLRWKP